MLDIKEIRKDPQRINELLKRRNPELSIDEVLEIDQKRREIQTKADELRNERKTTSKEIGQLIKEGKDVSEIQATVKNIGEEISTFEEQERELEEKQKMFLLTTPNVPDETTPVGTSEDDNVVIKTFAESTKFSFEPKAHWDLGTELNLIDFERGVKISESRIHHI